MDLTSRKNKIIKSMAARVNACTNSMENENMNVGTKDEPYLYPPCKRIPLISEKKEKNFNGKFRVPNR